MNLNLFCTSTAVAFALAIQCNAQHPTGEILYEQEATLSVRFVRADSADSSLNWVKNPIVVDNSQNEINLPTIMSNNFNVRKWVLVREKKQTVMHCYFVMPDFPCKELWLGGDETFIVDAKTGIHYKARGTYDNALWGETFALNLPRGTIVDLPIYFPPLPETVSDIYLYGVPRWTSRGGTILHLNIKPQTEALTLDKIKVPKLVEQNGPYNKDDMDTYDVYEGIHTILPTNEHSMAIWLTPQATYIAIACEMNWNNEYFGFSSKTVLIDERTRNMYKIRRIMGDIPLDRQFFIRANAGDWIAFLLEFEPLPYEEEQIRIGEKLSISYSEPEGEPFNVWGAGWNSSFYEHLELSQLISNRSIFQPFDPVIVK